ncbi:unnamed protein product [Dibothriocephalus latus]|uniref:MHD1 domain-containing protein n=1 Tax=Dibothriocephalus latus TaxID=60516 RepID=A0A3P6SSP5_DIBLA|nr:unnamed protein product [Dibothriocephalus latus]
MWTRLSEDLSVALEQHAQAKERFCKTSEYMNLCFKVKWFYKTHIAEVPEMQNQTPSYPLWFEPFVMQWLNENDEISMDFLRNAYQRDKKDGFHRSSEQALFSNSVVDVFTQLNQCFDIMKKLECPDPEVNARFINRFSHTVGKVLLTYAEVVKAGYDHWRETQETACILMNNIQQCRVQLERVYEAMGGDSLQEDTKVMLNDVIDDMAQKYSVALEPQILVQIKEVNKLLHQCATGANASVEAEADNILRPLMDHFESSLSVYADICEKTVLKRILKEISKETGAATLKNLTPWHCQILNIALEAIKNYFHAGGSGLKNTYLERSPELQSLQYALSLYTQTTDSLIKIFVSTQTTQGWCDWLLLSKDFSSKNE